MDIYYDTRFFFLPVFAFLKTYSSSASSEGAAVVKSAINGSPLLAELMWVTFFSALFLSFLMVSFRIQLYRFFCDLQFDVQIRISGSELPIPLTLSLLVTLLVPSSFAFWSIYLFILAASFFCDAIHSFLTGASYHQSFVVWRNRPSPHQSLPAPNGDDDRV